MKTEYNSANERIKRQYFQYLKEAKRHSEASVDVAAKSLARFEAQTKCRDFKSFHFEQAIAFKRAMSGHANAQTGEVLSKATVHATLSHLSRFFQWLAGQPGYKSRLRYSDADYFNLSQKDVRVAAARREVKAASVEQWNHVLSVMPAVTDVEMRNRAVVAFCVLTGARDGAVASLKLKHLDLGRQLVHQDARDVKTKFSKTFDTFFFPVGDEPRQIVAEWVAHLRRVLLWGDDDPLFPATLTIVGAEHQFTIGGLKREHWSTASPIRRIFRDACHVAGFQYYRPHSIRTTLVRLGERLCQTPEQFKAWSQNLGHEAVLTTFSSYGMVALQRQAEILTSLGRPLEEPFRASKEELATLIAEALRRAAEA